MKILVLQGPNLNLLGLKSSQSGKKLTLDKLNKENASKILKASVFYLPLLFVIIIIDKGI